MIAQFSIQRRFIIILVVISAVQSFDESIKETLRQSHPKYAKVEKQKDVHLTKMSKVGVQSAQAKKDYSQAHSSKCSPFAACIYHGQKKYYNHKYNSHQKVVVQATKKLKEIEALHGKESQQRP